jgi:hypothetical protein
VRPGLGRRLIAPSLFLLIAAVASVWTAVGLFRPVELPAPKADQGRAGADSAVRVKEETTVSIEANPFRRDRQAAPARFRMPGEGAEVPVGSSAPAASSLVLIGTAVLAGGGSFAMCQIGAEPPKLVRVGERYAGFTLRRVSQGHATFSTPTGKSLEVRVAKAGN